MAYLIGTDEAGYGPNLGPLLVSATAWQVPDGTRPEDLYTLLADAVAAMPKREPDGAGRRVCIADSKGLYQSGGGLGRLECGLLASLAVLGRGVRTWRAAWEALAPESDGHRRTIPWYADFDRPLPVDAEPSQIEKLAARLAAGLAANGAALLDVCSRPVFEHEFNSLVRQHGTKGAVLSHATLGLAARLAENFEAGPISIVCDKHGGRNRYGPLVETHFPGWLVEIHGEGRRQSVYRLGPPQRRVEIRFQVKAEACLPVALASMASKYLRELAMGALNAFWCGRVDGLHPTAGYPRDARRFKAAIAETQARLGIDDHVLWRQR